MFRWFPSPSPQPRGMLPTIFPIYILKMFGWFNFLMGGSHNCPRHILNILGRFPQSPQFTSVNCLRGSHNFPSHVDMVSVIPMTFPMIGGFSNSALYIDAWIDVCIDVFAIICKYICIYVYIYIYMYVSVCIRVYIHVNTWHMYYTYIF